MPEHFRNQILIITNDLTLTNVFSLCLRAGWFPPDGLAEPLAPDQDRLHFFSVPGRLSHREQGQFGRLSDGEQQLLK